MEIVRVEKRARTALSKEQKVAFVLLCVLGGSGIVLGALSFGADIRRPFEMQRARYTGEQVLTGSQRDAKEVEAQKTRDTDQDGLSDYDELYVYRTSAYLADSDSDGIPDKAEVFAGSDPNCPTGRDCGNFVLSNEATASATLPTPPAPPTSDGFAGLLNTTATTPQEFLQTLEGLSNDDIRAMLVQQGVPEADVNKLSDDDLREIVNKAILEMTASADAASAAASSTTPAP